LLLQEISFFSFIREITKHVIGLKLNITLVILT
jgi:hypothetical protein